ncbi:MAG: phytanoyl-CoA dioxygenase family protein [Acidimicrobiaceae bacterium]|nr:phytanoyl-CoA dioxygenase family protein [Acidimicrobiaceae bacterium]
MQRHPWNTNFAWIDHSGPFAVLDEGEVRQYDQRGFLVMPELLDAATTAELRDELDRFVDESDAFLEQAKDGRVSIAERGAITFSPHLVARSEQLRKLSMHRSIVGICTDLLAPDVNLYWDQAVYKKPEKPRRFPWHQDNGYTFVEPQQYLTCWLALTDATVDNGCPWVAPGLHRLGTLAHHFVKPLGYECFSDPPEGVTAVAAEVPSGGAVFFSSLTPHLTGPNTSSDVRKAYILQYAPVGAQTLQGDPAQGGPTGRTPCDHPDRQYAAARGGQPVSG